MLGKHCVACCMNGEKLKNLIFYLTWLTGLSTFRIESNDYLGIMAKYILNAPSEMWDTNTHFVNNAI